MHIHVHMHVHCRFRNDMHHFIGFGEPSGDLDCPFVNPLAIFIVRLSPLWRFLISVCHPSDHFYSSLTRPFSTAMQDGPHRGYRIVASR